MCVPYRRSYSILRICVRNQTGEDFREVQNVLHMQYYILFAVFIPYNLIRKNVYFNYTNS